LNGYGVVEGIPSGDRQAELTVFVADLHGVVIHLGELPDPGGRLIAGILGDLLIPFPAFVDGCDATRLFRP